MDELAENWERKYATDYAEKTVAYEELTGKRTSDQVVLIDKQKRWELDKQHKLERMSELERRAAEEQAAREVEQKQYLAAARIQFAWRCYWRKRSKILKRLRRKQIAAIRKQKAELAKKFPLLAMQKRQAEAEARKTAQDQRRAADATPAQETPK